MNVHLLVCIDKDAMCYEYGLSQKWMMMTMSVRFIFYLLLCGFSAQM